MPFGERIDTHAHLLPPFYRQASIEAGQENPDGMPELPVSFADLSNTLDRPQADTFRIGTLKPTSISCKN